jgi:hypothetical protein
MPDTQNDGVELHGQFNIRQFAELLNLDPSDTTRLANFIRKHKTGQRPTYQEVGAAARAFVGLVDADQELTNKAAIMLKRVDAEPKMESAVLEKAPPGFDQDLEKKLLKQYADNPERAYATMWTIHNKKNESVNEGIRVAKEGIEECWDDMGGQEMTQDNNGEQMSVTISMPGKNISVTTDSAEEIGSILRLAGINVDGVAPQEPTEMPGGEEAAPEVVFVGAQGMGDSGNDVGQESPLTTNAGNSGGDYNSGGNSGDGDSGEETKEATQTPSSWTDSQGNKHPATKVQGDRYGNADSDKEKEEEVDEAKKPDADGDGVPDWADKKEGEDDNEAKNESARILALAGVAESKLMNSPAGTSMDEPKEYDSLPSRQGLGGGNKDYGLNRADGQGENPMGMHTEDTSVEEAFANAMGEYRKFVAENISRKK